ncbi:hypothetical protein [Paludibacter sp.]|uniref:hypothetical protein n=1 Tax=Paludibacter sp. TaxID=1898105 RepID=UPI001354013D|nr:hypothetical protein [Paludibacter sp.]MTK53071.1 hypothetical protein [Paludibacter sp.]
MNTFLIELPYVLVPVAMTMVYRNVNYSLREYTFYGTGILIFLYPILLVFTENALRVNISTPLIDRHLFVYFLINTLFFVPLALLLQLIFNAIFLHNEENEWNEIE